MTKEWLAPKAQNWMTNLGQAYQDAKGFATEKLPIVKSAILDGLTAAKETVTEKAQTVMTWLGDAYRSETVQGFPGRPRRRGDHDLEQNTAWQGNAGGKGRRVAEQAGYRTGQR